MDNTTTVSTDILDGLIFATAPDGNARVWSGSTWRGTQDWVPLVVLRATPNLGKVARDKLTRRLLGDLRDRPKSSWPQLSWDELWSDTDPSQLGKSQGSHSGGVEQLRNRIARFLADYATVIPAEGCSTLPADQTTGRRELAKLFQSWSARNGLPVPGERVFFAEVVAVPGVVPVRRGAKQANGFNVVVRNA